MKFKHLKFTSKGHAVKYRFGSEKSILGLAEQFNSYFVLCGS